MTTAAIYTRVSTIGQAEEGTSLQTQLEACQEAARSRGLEVPEGFEFCEQASGGDLERPLLSLARELVRTGQAATLIAYSTDRVARNPVHLFIVAEECEDNGAELLLVSEPLDSTPEGQLIRYVKGYAAQIEREKTRERTMRGKAAVARAGRLPIGTGSGLYGYDYDKTAKCRTVRESEASVVREAFAWAVEGASVYEVARRLNARGIPTKRAALWCPRTVSKMLTNEAYTGVTIYGRQRTRKAKGGRIERHARPRAEWIQVDGFTPAIIDKVNFDTVQRELRNRPKRGRPRNPYLLTGYIVCADCGRPLVGTLMGKRYRYYRCRATWATAVSPKTCNVGYINADKLESDIWDTVKGVLEDPKLILGELRRTQSAEPSMNAEAENLRGELRRLKGQESRLVRLFEFGEISEGAIRERAEALREEREGIGRRLHDIERQAEAVRRGRVREEEIFGYCAQVRDRLADFDYEGKRLAFRALEIKATVRPDQVVVNGIVPLAPAIITTGRTSA